MTVETIAENIITIAENIIFIIIVCWLSSVFPHEDAEPSGLLKISEKAKSLQLWAEKNIQQIGTMGEIFFEYNENAFFNAANGFDFKQNLCSNSDMTLLSKFLCIALLNAHTKKEPVLSNIFSFKENIGVVEFFFTKKDKTICSFKAIWSADTLSTYDIDVITYIFFKILQDTTHLKHFSKQQILAISPFEYASYASSILTPYKQFKDDWEKSLCNFTYLLYHKMYNNADFQKFEKEVPFDKFLFSYEKMGDIPTTANLIFKEFTATSEAFIKTLFCIPLSKINIIQKTCLHRISLIQETIGTLTIFYIVGKSNNEDIFHYTVAIKTGVNPQRVLSRAMLNFFSVSATNEKTAFYSGIVSLNDAV